MARSAEHEALELVASVMVTGHSPFDGDDQVRLEQLLQQYGCAVRRWGSFYHIKPDPATASPIRGEVLRLLSGMPGLPSFFVLPMGRRHLLLWSLPPFVLTHLLVLLLILLVASFLTRFISGPYLALAALLLWSMAGLLVVAGFLLHRSQSRRFARLLEQGRQMLREEKSQVERMRTEAQQNAESWTLLREAEESFRQTTNLADFYPLLGSFLRRLLPDYDGLSVWRLDEVAGQLEVQYVEGRYADPVSRMRRVPASAGAIGHAIQIRRPFVIPNLLGDSRVIHPPGIRPSGSGMAVPLITTEGPIGAFMISRAHPGSFTAAAVWGAEMLAAVAALRLHSLRSREREQRLMEEFTRLQHLVQPRKAGPQVTDLLEQVASSVAIVSQADAALVYQAEGEHSLRLCYSSGLRPGVIARLMNLPPTASPAWMAVELAVTSSLSRADLSTWPEYERFFTEGELERCLVLPILRANGEVAAAVLVAFRAGREVHLTPERLTLCDTYARFAGAAVHNLELYATVVRQSGELRELIGRLVSAQERERRRIALDLHDWLVQGLAGPSFTIQAADRLLDRSPELARAQLADALQQLNQASDEMRRIMKGLRPHLLDELGLTEAIGAYAVEFSRTHGIDCRVLGGAEGGPGKGSQEALVAFRIVQEALNNVAKHSGASAVEVQLRTATGSLEVDVIDNGRGFDTSLNPDSGRLGLLGMRERAALVRGKVSVISSPSQGTHVAILIPLADGGPVVGSLSAP